MSDFGFCQADSKSDESIELELEELGLSEDLSPSEDEPNEEKLSRYQQHQKQKTFSKKCLCSVFKFKFVLYLKLT